VLEAVIREGATTINIPDTRRLCRAAAIRRIHKKLRRRIPNSDKAVWSVHCHNDLGMAVANSLAAVMIGGARADRMHHQRPGRARRQHLARGGGDGGEDARRLL